MSYPNSALSAGELSVMAIVVVACMAFWLIAVFVAARDPRRHHAARLAGWCDTSQQRDSLVSRQSESRPAPAD